MAEKFFDALADQISDRFGLGENTNKTLDILEDGHTRRYGTLGDFAGKFDQSSERRYLEEGYLRKDLFNVQPKQLEILMQEPEVTVLIKKKMFSSIAENFRPDFMDQEEKLFYKASRILFQNKCKQISAFEKLSKIERVSSAVGEFDTQMLPIVMNLVDELQASTFSFGGLFQPTSLKFSSGRLGDVIEKIRKVYAFSPNRTYTSWITDDKTLFRNQLGEGTGVIELTNVTRVSTSTAVSGGGRCSISIADPYQLMLITESDIERALSDATNPTFNHRIFQLGKESAENIIARNIKLLNDKRRVRGVSEITFKTNADTLLGERIVAIVDRVGEKINFTYDAALGLAGIGIGKGVQVSDDSLKGGIILGNEGLNTASDRTIPGLSVLRASSSSELSIFSDIITNMFNKMQIDNNARTATNQKNDKINYARKKLRFYFLGKRIIQPMDQVNIFIGSKSMFDNKILSGLQNSFNAYGFLKNLDNAFYDLKKTADTLFQPSANLDIQLEKTMSVGANFPNFLWGLMRNQFVNERSGSHVWAGLVDSASGNYSSGKYTVDIQCKDNMSYFDQGYVNFKPSADVFNGALYEPLTPFQTRFDSVSSNFKGNAPQLLDENTKLLGTKLLKFKIGGQAGKLASATNLLQSRKIDAKKNVRKVYYMPDGMVYKWKEGIGTFVQFGDSFQSNDPNTLGSVSVTKNPFAGQDVMNVLSLLITGEPYNFANYYKAATSLGNHLRDPQSNQDSAFSFYASLKSDLTKRNMLWGNFYPFKNLTMDEETFKKVLTTQLSAINKNDDIDQKLKELADVRSAIMKSDAINAPSETKSMFGPLFDTEAKLQQEINDLTGKVLESMQDKTSLLEGFSLIGNDVSFDNDDLLNPTGNKKSLSDPNVRKLIRRKTNFLTRRMSWKVRANEDQNLFIVDDYYDKDYDIIAFEKSLSGKIEVFDSEFSTIRDKINGVAGMLNLEVFCDSQGHIRVRPPQYNKMPSSIFYKMLQLKNDKGIQLFPQFLADLFVNQIDAIIRRIEIVENQIRFSAAILGKNDDESAEELVNTDASNTVGNSEGPFRFISDHTNWKIPSTEIIVNTSNPGSNTDIFSTNIIRGQVFGPRQRASVLMTITDQYTISGKITNFMTTDRVNSLRQRLMIDTGQNVNVDDFLQKTEEGKVAVVITKSPDVFKIVKEISEKVSERQKLLKIAHNYLKNLKEAKSLDENPDTRNKLMFPNLSKNSMVPEMFESMIEDETYDDLGPNSGSRFIIKNSMIKTISDNETAPEYTMIEVKGMLDPTIDHSNLTSSLNTNASLGGGLITAAAVDYDMWRMYGFKGSHSIPAIFLSDPEGQCAPYAASILSRARKEVLRADLTLSGNEYMQPGEVVYVEDRGLLYYVESVSHEFTYGQSFNTSIKLTYGHSPGEYIPTAFDVIGKMLYSNRDNADIINYRHQSAYQENSLGAIVNSNNNLFNGGNGAHNQRVIQDIINTTLFTINSNDARGTNKKAFIELRIYYNSSNGQPINDDLNKAAEKVKSILVGDGVPEATDILNSNLKSLASYGRNDIIKVERVDIGQSNEQRSPSSKAMDAARNLGSNNSIISSTDPVVKALFSFVIDCWVKFEHVQPDTPGTSS